MSESKLPFLGRIPPCSPEFDVCDRLFTHAVDASDLILRRTAFFQQLTYNQNLLPGERCVTASFTSVGLVIPDPIDSHVLDARTPAEVFQAVVCFPAWTVQGFLTFRTLPNERFKHQMVYGASFPETAFVQINLKVTVTAQVRCQVLPPSYAAARLPGERPHVPEITNFVEVVETAYTTPVKGHWGTVA